MPEIVQKILETLDSQAETEFLIWLSQEKNSAFDRGYTQGRERVSELEAMSYQHGYDDGYADGYDQGYVSGRDDETVEL